jgi:hypothetical protein
MPKKSKLAKIRFTVRNRTRIVFKLIDCIFPISRRRERIRWNFNDIFPQLTFIIIGPNSCGDLWEKTSLAGVSDVIEQTSEILKRLTATPCRRVCLESIFNYSRI